MKALTVLCLVLGILAELCYSQTDVNGTEPTGNNTVTQSITTEKNDQSIVSLHTNVNYYHNTPPEYYPAFPLLLLLLLLLNGAVGMTIPIYLMMASILTLVSMAHRT